MLAYNCDTSWHNHVTLAWNECPKERGNSDSHLPAFLADDREINLKTMQANVFNK